MTTTKPLHEMTNSEFLKIVSEILDGQAAREGVSPTGEWALGQIQSELLRRLPDDEAGAGEERPIHITLKVDVMNGTKPLPERYGCHKTILVTRYRVRCIAGDGAPGGNPWIEVTCDSLPEMTAFIHGVEFIAATAGMKCQYLV